ncbi:MAG: sulfatase-like hydrolase/transferase [Deltaproteobacteria bacterium]|nr:sulfatase-like hydrolase/transferase [Deltaproteobacteria bacterium]
MKRSLIAWALAGAVAGLFLGLFDTVLLVAARVMFFDASEILRTSAEAVALTTGAGLAALTLIGLLAHGFAVVSRALRIEGKPWPRTLLAGALLAVPAFLALWRLTSGPQASLMPGRSLAVALAAAIAGLLSGIAAVRLPALAGRSPGGRNRAAATGLACAAALQMTDLSVLVRLYPVFHAGLTALAFVIGGVGVFLAIEPVIGRLPRRLPVVAVASAVLLCALSLVLLMRTQNPRFVVGERTAAASDVLDMARLLAPRAKDTAAASVEPDASEIAAQAGPFISRPGSTVIMISVDAMRYDRLAALGASRRVAPNLDALSERSVLFARAYTPVPHTSYALSSLLTGKYTRPLFDVPGASQVHETWPEILQRFRYKTAAFFTRAVFFIDRARFEPYRRTSYGFSWRKVDYLLSAEDRVDQLMAFLETVRGRKSPAFAWVHFFEPHEPYDETCLDFGPADVDRYDCEISRVDKALGRLLPYLDEAFPEAIVIGLADHGEEFGDHGGRYHGTTLYDEQVRVPLMIRVPGIEPRVVHEPVSLVDLQGTVLRILDVPVPTRVRSRDLAGLMVGKAGPSDACSEVHDLAMVVSEGHKLVCDRVDDVCRLYDLAADPHETRSVAGEKPEIAARLKARLLAWGRSHARYELRPVEAQGATGWPAAVQVALGGDPSAVPGLIDVLSRDGRPAVRRKAAELLARLWGSRDAASVASIDARGDPEVAGWLAVIRTGAGVAVDLKGLQAAAPMLSSVWRALAASRVRAGDRDAVPDLIAVIGDKDLPADERSRAVVLLGESGDADAVDGLVKALDEYQLMPDAAAALGRLRDGRAVKPLLAALEPETFAERRGAIVRALGRIGGSEVVPAISSELQRDDPTPGALAALDDLGALPRRGARLPSRIPIVAFGAPAGPLTPRLASVARAILRVAAKADGGSVVVACNGAAAGRLPLVAGEQESAVELSGCASRNGRPLVVTLSITPADVEAEIRAMALIKDLAGEPARNRGPGAARR